MKQILRYRKWRKIIQKSGIFDPEYYLFAYPDVRLNDVDPILHYIKFGAKEGRRPGVNFDTDYYLNKYPDVKSSGINPLVHYILYGAKENRSINQFQLDSHNEEKVSRFVNNEKVQSSLFEFQFHQNNIREKDYIEYKKNKTIDVDIKLIAYYLPQFHPIPQNDKSWGLGFTEWTNVTKAVPQFDGHYQPRLAGELGYYDLRLKEVQKRQIELAKNYGLHGFCYHYYWFDGKKVMDKPLQQVLDNPDLDFPFCINWANENWTKRWDGLDQDVILAQNHTKEDDIAFIEAIKPILNDSRYIRINDKPLLMVYRPNLFPDICETVKRWREYARESGVGELYLVLSHAFENINPKDIGFDAAAEFAPNGFKVDNVTNNFNFFNKNYEGTLYDYESAMRFSLSYNEPDYTKFRSVCPSWDNEARKPGKGITFVNARPDNYSKWLEYALYYTDKNRKKEEKLIFVNAWNEWAEGAYLEPDRRFGYAYLEETYKQLQKFSNDRLELIKQSHINQKSSDTAVIIHLFYVELWEEMKSKLAHLGNKFDLYININNSCALDLIQEVKNDFPNARIYSCENRGRDILPFIEIMKDILPLNYEYVCKIHSKKSLHRSDGERWRNELIDGLLGSEERINKSKAYLDNGAGVVVANGNIRHGKKYIGSNELIIKDFAKKAGFDLPEDYLFPAGSMFWFKPSLLEEVVGVVNDAEFPFESGQLDGTLAHALERIVGLLCAKENMSIQEI